MMREGPPERPQAGVQKSEAIRRTPVPDELDPAWKLNSPSERGSIR
jgi:hypothetical protein